MCILYTLFSIFSTMNAWNIEISCYKVYPVKSCKAVTPWYNFQIPRCCNCFFFLFLFLFFRRAICANLKPIASSFQVKIRARHQRISNLSFLDTLYTRATTRRTRLHPGRGQFYFVTVAANGGQSRVDIRLDAIAKEDTRGIDLCSLAARNVFGVLHTELTLTYVCVCACAFRRSDERRGGCFINEGKWKIALANREWNIIDRPVRRADERFSIAIRRG